jgi:hypothetical protein
MKLVDYLPEVLRPYLEFQELMAAEQEEKDAVWEKIQFVFSERFLESMSEGMVKKWEEFMYLAPSPDDPISVRKASIRARWMESPPFTYEKLLSSLARLFDSGEYDIDLDIDHYKLTVNLKSDYDRMALIIATYLDRVIPANIYLVTNVNTNDSSDMLYLGGRAAAELDMTVYQGVADDSGGASLAPEVTTSAKVNIGTAAEVVQEYTITAGG